MGLLDVFFEPLDVLLDKQFLVLFGGTSLGHLNLERGAPCDIEGSDDSNGLASHGLDSRLYFKGVVVLDLYVLCPSEV